MLYNIRYTQTMGIKKLYKFINNTFPNVFYDISTNIKGKSFVLDGTQQIYTQIGKLRLSNKELFLNNGTNMSHIQGLFNSIIQLLNNNSIPIYVFDGKPIKVDSPLNKQTVLEERKINLNTKTDNLSELKKQCDNFVIEKLNKNVPIENIKQQLYKTTIYKQYRKLYSTTIRLKHYYIEDWVKILELIGIPVIHQEYGEADPICSMITNNNKHIYGLISDDSDMLVYGCKRILTNPNINKLNSYKVIEINQLLEQINYKINCDFGNTNFNNNNTNNTNFNNNNTNNTNFNNNNTNFNNNFVIDTDGNISFSNNNKVNSNNFNNNNFNSNNFNSNNFNSNNFNNNNFNNNNFSNNNFSNNNFSNNNFSNNYAIDTDGNISFSSKKTTNNIFTYDDFVNFSIILGSDYKHFFLKSDINNMWLRQTTDSNIMQINSLKNYILPQHYTKNNNSYLQENPYELLKKFVISGKNIKDFILEKDLEQFAIIKQNFIVIQQYDNKQYYWANNDLIKPYLTEKPIWNEPKYEELEKYLLNLNLESKYIKTKISRLKELYRNHMLA